MKEFFSLYGWNILSLLLATKLLAIIYFYGYRKKEVALTIIPLGFLLFFLVSFASFEQNLSVGLGILGVLSFIRLRSSIDSLSDAIVLLTAVVLGILAAQVINIWFLFSTYLLLLLVFLGSVVLGKQSFIRERKILKIKLDELVILKNSKEKEAFLHKLQNDLGIEVLQFEIVSLDYLRDATQLSITYLSGQ